MLDRPEAATLLRAMAETLDAEVLPATSGGARHAARVVANLCRILERETALGQGAAATTRQALAELLGQEGSLEELVAVLDRRLEESDPDFDERARRLILSDVERRLAIDRPGYAK